MPCTKPQVTITFDGATVRFSYVGGGENVKNLCCCACASVPAGGLFLFVAGEKFEKGCIISVDGNGSGDLQAYLDLIEAQVVANC